ncbi:DUF5074 domain-containing protein [Pedobacter sp. Hv1]|uniref:DUF5074 domain-containing protein n=1 Tax=Pedobacter sp. Hv1 TaxID=1740090 RepID=UPI0006D8B69E|nr:DUF5074 domain-containing protein [Pedobacter sp. Hv1]KQC00992.1 hypothetical protein AQF98_09990 [Pedobacter sp. Hv1]
MKYVHLRYITAFLFVLLFTASCKKEQMATIVLNHERVGDGALSVKIKQDLILNPKMTGQVDTYQWLEDGKEIANTASYKFNRATPGVYTLIFQATNAAGTTTLTYRIKALGAYGDGVLLLSYTDKTGSGAAEISHIDEQGLLNLDVFSKVNPGLSLSSSANNLYHFNNQYYVSSATGPNHLSVLDDQTLKLKDVVSQSGITGITYFATTDGKTGYANVTNRRKPGLYPVDLSNKSIAADPIEGSKDISLVPINTINQSIVAGAGKQLVQLDNGKVKVLYTYKENVAGVVNTAGKTTWVVVQGFTNKAKFVKLDQNLKAVDSVELATTYKLPANGILTASGNDDYIYWQETSRGVICRFNTATKTASEFVDPGNVGISFATAWKVNPKNGELYIADSPGLFTGEENWSDVYIFDQTGKVKKQYKKAGRWITDIVFPK